MSFADLLIHTCDIQRFTDTGPDDYNQPTKAWADLHAGEPCRMVSTKGVEIHIDAKVVVSNWELFVGDIDVTEQDRVIFDGETYNIVLVQPRSNDVSEHHKELSLVGVK